jgi:hypothetical protein
VLRSITYLILPELPPRGGTEPIGTSPFNFRYFGRITALVAWITVPLGISLYATILDPVNEGVHLGLLLGWVIFVILVFAFMQYRVGQTHDDEADKP